MREIRLAGGGRRATLPDLPIYQNCLFTFNLKTFLDFIVQAKTICRSGRVALRPPRMWTHYE
jgi:hypothetical protein